MKRKYVALMLGMTLALSSMTYAEEATEAVVTEAAGEMELSEEEDALYGEITEIGEDSITIALGTLSVDEVQPASGETGAEAAEDTNAEVAEEAADAEEVTDGEVTAAADSDVVDENGAPEEQPLNGIPGRMTFELTGEEETIQITEDTLFYREAAMQAPGEISEEFVEEAADGEAVIDEDAAVNEEVALEEENAEEAVAEGNDVEVTAEENGVELLAEISEKPEQQLEEISFEDLMEGDVLKITFDEDGNAETVTIVMTEPAELLEEEVMDEEAIMTLEEADTEEAAE